MHSLHLRPGNVVGCLVEVEIGFVDKELAVLSSSFPTVRATQSMLVNLSDVRFDEGSLIESFEIWDRGVADENIS